MSAHLLRRPLIASLLLTLSACDELEVNVTQELTLSDQLSVRAEGVVLSERVSSEQELRHLIELAPHSLNPKLTVSYTGCDTQELCFMIPQRLPFASISAQPYLDGQTSAQEALNELSVGVTWRERGVSPLLPEGVTSLSARVELPWRSGARDHYRLRCFSLSRPGARLSYLERSDPERSARVTQLLGQLDESSEQTALQTLPTLTDELERLPCATLSASQEPLSEAPLSLALKLNLSPSTSEANSSSEVTLGRQMRLVILSELLWREGSEDLDLLIERVNQTSPDEPPLEAVIFLGDLLDEAAQSEQALFKLRERLSALNAPWFVTRGDADSWSPEVMWQRVFGWSSFSFERLGVRVGVVNTMGGEVGDAEQALIKSLRADEPLLWSDEPSPSLRLLLSHRPLLALDEPEGLTQRSDAIRLLNLAVQSDVSVVISAHEPLEHPGLKVSAAPSFKQSRAWLELRVSEACLSEAKLEGASAGDCLDIQRHALP